MLKRMDFGREGGERERGSSGRESFLHRGLEGNADGVDFSVGPRAATGIRGCCGAECLDGLMVCCRPVRCMLRRPNRQVNCWILETREEARLQEGEGGGRGKGVREGRIRIIYIGLGSLYEYGILLVGNDELHEIDI